MSLPPSGEIPQGAIRFNTDSQKLEFYAQGEWWIMSTDTPNLGRSVDSTPGPRGVFMRGQDPSSLTKIDYISISSLGAPSEFGDLSVTNGGGNAPFSSRTRAIFHGGAPGDSDIEFVTIASTGDAVDWGANLVRGSTFYAMGAANETRGLSVGNFPASQTKSDFVTIASAGTVNEFGDLITAASHGASVQSPTRAVFCGGYITPGGTRTKQIQSYQIATTGAAQHFGDLSDLAWNSAGACNTTRGVMALGAHTSSATNVNIIEYITISTFGNSTNFGDSVTSNGHRGGGCCSPTRGLFMGGWTGSDETTEMETINIQTEGNAVDFGDLTTAAINVYGCSNAHGGL